MARYKDAIRWIVENDDTDWLDSSNGSLSVTGCLVADLFGKDDETVVKDIRYARTQRIAKTHLHLNQG